MIRTYSVRFKEPLTQTWVEGKNEMVTCSRADAAEFMEELEVYFNRLYGPNFELRFCDTEGEDSAE